MVVGFLARSGLRRRLAGGIALAVLAGMAAGIAMAAWAGARRTESAYPRMVEATDRYDVRVDTLGDRSRFDEAALSTIDGVEQVAVVDGWGVVPMYDGLPDLSTGYFFTSAVDELAYREIARPLLLEGRLPDPDSPEEVFVNEYTADLGMTVGSTVTVCVYEFAEVEAVEAETEEEVRALVPQLCDVRDLRVVGEGRFVDDLALGDANAGQPSIVATPAFGRTSTKDPSYAFAGLVVAAGTDPAALLAAILEGADSDAGLRVQGTDLRTTVVQRTVQPYVQSMAIFALLLAVATIGVLGPALARWAATPGDDLVILAALGVRRGQLRAAAAARALVVGVVAAVGAVALALLASGSFPIGPVRLAEPDPGRRADLLVLLLGAAGVVALSALAGALASTRAAPTDRPRSRVALALGRATSNPPAAIGIRAAFTTTRAGPSPAATLTGIVVAVAAIAAALCYQSGLARLLDDPARSGWTWDAAYEAFESSLPDEVVEVASSDDLVARASVGYRIGVDVDGEAVPGFSFDDVRGSLQPVVLDGRTPSGSDEVALAGQTLDRLGRRIGDVVAVRGPSGAVVDATVVGRTLLPIINLGDDLSVGEGLLADQPLVDALGGADPGFVLFDLVDGAARRCARRRRPRVRALRPRRRRHHQRAAGQDHRRRGGGELRARARAHG